MSSVQRVEEKQQRVETGSGGEADEVLDELVRLQPDLRARALFLTQGSAAADDLVQDVMERALLARHRFQRGTNLRAWLGSIMRNLFIDGYRQRVSKVLCDVDLESPAAEEPPSPIDHVTMDDVLEALAQLKPSDQEIFALSNFHHLSYREISSRLGIPMNTAGTRLRRVRKKLCRLLTRVSAIRERLSARYATR